MTCGKQHGEHPLTSQVITTTDLADYQAGSIVSRTILDKKVGTVTFFAFDAGEGLSEHTAPFDAMVQLLEGRATVSICGTPYQLHAGQMIIMPAKEPHAVHADEKCKMLLTMIRS